MRSNISPFNLYSRVASGLLTGALLGVVSVSTVRAQVDSTSLISVQEPIAPPLERSMLRPTLGLGTGMFAFYGDVGRNHSTYSPLVARIGYDLRATVPLTPWLEGGLYALHGRLGMNERSLERNLNFESRITIGGFQLRYNFHQLLKRDRFVEPFINLGFESVEFLTKTDLMDAQGRRYNYWSDGSIRDIAEDSPNAEQAIIIQRDHVYETDVRELNADGFGKYLERTWAIPVGAGVRMDLGGGFDFRVGATMHFTFTDMVDGVSDQSIGGRRGDGRNDRFLYSSFSVGYAIPIERGQRKRKVKMTPLSTEELDLIVLEGDSDGDGVPDLRDRCPNTPPGVAVDINGCPLDSDNDGVPDHRDDEPDSPRGAIVDARGVTITDDDLLKAWLNWKDSGNVNTVFTRVESIGPPIRNAKPTRPSRVYAVQVGTHVEGISEELMQRILSIPDVRTIERGDTTYYVVGNYDNLPDAIKRELELYASGVQGTVIGQEGGRLIDITEQAQAERMKTIVPATRTDEAGVVTVRVQLGAFRNRLSENIFREVPDLVTIKGDDGLTRYYTGAFTDVNKAAGHKVDMLMKGFDGAFLVAFREGKRVSIREAGARLTGEDDMRYVPAGTINKDLIKFRIQVGNFTGNVPIETMDKYIELGDVEAMPGSEAVRYFHGTFNSRTEADRVRQQLLGKGFDDAFVVGAIDGRIISAEEADMLLREP